MAENAYRQAPEDVWVAAKSVMGTTQSPAWYSITTNELIEWIGGHFTLRALMMLGCVAARLSRIRKNPQETSALLSGDKLLVREKADQLWFVVPYKLSTTCYLGFPVTSGSFADDKLWFLFGQHRPKLYPLVMVKEQEWDAMAYIWELQ